MDTSLYPCSSDKFAFVGNEGNKVLQQVSTCTREDHPQDACTICLSDIDERAVAVPCNHLSFDFICLIQWLQTNASCPLCKAPVLEVQYNFRDFDDFERYMVPRASEHRSESVVPPPQPISEVLHDDGSDECQRFYDTALQRRLDIYKHDLLAQHVGSNIESGYKDFSPLSFSQSVDLQTRARTFLKRELQVLFPISRTVAGPSRSFRSQQASASYLMEVIVAILRTHEPRAHDGRAEELLADFMPVGTAQKLLHELTAWLRSPFARLSQWDEAVQYAHA